ncbi:hypothetical protein LTR95_016505 [Oleoguttula sp. CCFEE 5521]
MAQTLPFETEAAYATIIDDILATADLTTVSAKRIRKALQEKVGVDLTPHKDAITKLIMERFDKVHTDAASPEPAEPAPITNGHTHGGDTPPRKKRKADSDDDDDLSSSAAGFGRGFVFRWEIGIGDVEALACAFRGWGCRHVDCRDECYTAGSEA